VNGLLLLASTLGLARPAPDAARDSLRAGVTLSGFVDAYYAYDFGRPAQRDRAFTTQAARHNEFNLNLAHIALSLERARIRGRLALQVGTSVQANYAGEANVGALSGATLSRHVQEATAGLRLAKAAWLDAGIYFSYVGWEGWISRDNPTYSRSLVAEYTPYYLSGVRIIWQPARRLTVQGHLMNGWQKISEDNAGKALGARVDFVVTPKLTLAYGGFVGNEQPSNLAGATRWFHQFMLRALPSAGLLFQAQADYGRERGAKLREWYGGVLIGRASLTRQVALSARVERFSDSDQVVAATTGAAGLVATGASMGVDIALPEGLLWRTELRGLRATKRVFPKAGIPNASRTNSVVLTSLALTL